jgi:ferredoxin
MYTVTVDAEKCEGCEECVNNCPVSVFELKESDLCEGCETCISVCPSGAVTLTEM